MARSPALSAFARALRTCVLSALGAGVTEVVLGAKGASHLTGGDFVAALLGALGPWAVFGLFAGLGCGAISAGFAAYFAGDARTLRSLSDEDDRSLAGALVTLGFAAIFEIALVRTYLLAIGLQMSSRKNTALSSGIVAAIGLLVLALFGPGLLVLARRVTALIPRPRAIILLGLALAGTTGAAILVVGSLDWRIIDFGPVRGFGLFLALALGHVAFWRTIGKQRFAALTSSAAPTWILVGALTLGAASLGWSASRLGSSPRAVHLLGEGTQLTRKLLGAARALADADHDGYSARFGGGDCDDHDSAINPGAEDLPGDGIDQDCDGADAQVVQHTIVKTPTDAPRTWKKDLNLLVITIDTLRADRLNEQVMPNAWRFAQGAVRFDTVYAQAPNTPRSFPSFLTSRIPSKVKWASQRRNFPPMVPSTEGGDPTFFEELARAGLPPHGVFSHFYLVPENGITQGFVSWDNAGALTLHDSNTDIAAPRITERVIKELGKLATEKKRFALWTHLFDPHSKYMDHPEFPVHGGGFEAIEKRYDGEVSFTDKHIGMMLDALQAAGLADSTIVVLMADHGEAFGEHKFAGERMFFHGETIYDELLRVPLAIRVPGLPPRVVADPMMLIDLGPTLLDLFGVTAPASMQGRSVVPAMLGQPLAPGPILAELLPVPSWQHKWRFIRQDGWELLDKQSEGSVELYDAIHDPKQTHDVAEANPERVKALRAALVRGLP